jgi:predicted enzyme related to lactoylglutathione lyase
MIKGLRGATIWSEDLNNLLPLGPPRLALGTHSEVHGRNADPARHMVGLATDGVTADWKRSKNAGVEFVEDPTDYGTLRIATLKDPECNLVQLLQPLRA